MNLKQLSAHLGLSPTTVSRALNGYPEVSERTRARVVAAADRLGYRPNPVARRLATGRTELVGIIYHAGGGHLIDDYFEEFVAGIGLGLADRGIDLVLGLSMGANVHLSYRRLVEAGRVDGLIIGEMRLDDDRLDYLSRSKMPFVAHGRARHDEGYAWLDIDNEGGFKRATTYLLQLGHRRIAFLNGQLACTFAFHRERGFLDAHRQEGIEPDPDLLRHGAMSEEFGYRQASELLARENRPTAILLSGALSAPGVLRAAREKGLDVPCDLSLIVHDDHLQRLSADSVAPALTTVDQPINDAGRHIAHMLLERIAGRPAHDLQELWPTSLIIRDSAAPPPE